MTAVEETRHRPPLWRDVRVLRAVIQVLAGAAVLIILYVLWFNLTNNLRAAGLPTGFDFLTQPLGVDIPGSDISPSAPIWRGLLNAVKNTLALVVVGIPLLTLIGVLVGVARLSTNWLVAKAARALRRDHSQHPPTADHLLRVQRSGAPVPGAPGVAEPLRPGDRQQPIPRHGRVHRASPTSGLSLRSWLWPCSSRLAVWWWRTRRSEQTGEHHHRFLWALGVFSAISLIGFVALGGPIGLSRPILDGRALEGGYTGLAAYWAVLAALVLYTASHVAEIVRGSILAVPRGQSEAANAIALTPFQRLRYVMHAPGDAHRHPADHQPVPELHQEHLTRHCHRLRRDDPDHLPD